MTVICNRKIFHAKAANQYLTILAALKNGNSQQSILNNYNE